jgi:hypothetical protein
MPAQLLEQAIDRIVKEVGLILAWNYNGGSHG